MSNTATFYTNPDDLAEAVAKRLIEQGYVGSAGASVWTKSECAKALKTNTVTLDELIAKGLPCKDIAAKGSQRRALRFVPSAVLAWMRENDKK